MPGKLLGRVFSQNLDPDGNIFFDGMNILQLFLRHSNNLSRTLQCPSVTSVKGKALLFSNKTFAIFWVRCKFSLFMGQGLNLFEEL